MPIRNIHAGKILAKHGGKNVILDVGFVYRPIHKLGFTKKNFNLVFFLVYIYEMLYPVRMVPYLY
jgi:hypothetical protein